MTILFFDNKNEIGNEIQEVMGKQIKKEGIEIYRTAENLYSRFHMPKADISIMVLLADSKTVLIDLFLIRNLFFDIPIILILPDRDEETISRGHKFYPRFVSYVDSNFSELALVLNKMIRNLHSNGDKIANRCKSYTHHMVLYNHKTDYVLPSQ